MTGQKDVNTLKKLIREKKKEARRSVDRETVEKRSELVCQRLINTESYRNAETVMVYNAVRGEVILKDLEEDARLKGKKLLYPLCIEGSKMLALCPNTPESFKKGAYGIPEPDREDSEEVNPEEIDLVVVPCTAFDDKCRRMGMGAGYYDRFLKRCSKAYMTAAAFEFQKVEAVPVDENDVMMDAVVTEEKCRSRQERE